MNEVLAIGLQAMQQDMARVERIGMNMANAMTPGYRREVAVPVAAHATSGATASRGFAREVEALRAAPGAAADTAGAPPAPAALRLLTDLRAGTLKATGQPLDLALAGEGFFELATPQGPAYTRMGGLRLDPRGRLVTAQGHAVMGQGGEIVLSTGRPVIDEAGRIFEPRADGTLDTVPVAQLKVVGFEQPQQLRRLGGGLLAGAAGTDPMPAALAEAEVRLRQGHLENSNVDSAREMVELLSTMRHFESMQKAMTGYDEMLGAAVRKLGDLG